MMREYLENLVRNKIPVNSGYVYVASEDVAIPMHKVTLGISKRRTTNLELVEEMVIRFVSIGVNDIDTIANALGLHRDFLDITIGDLHVKNLAFHSSGKCILMAKGRESLKTLSTSKREKDVLRNIYVDAVSGNIFGEKVRGFKNSGIHDDIKVKHQIDANAIELYRQNMGSLSQIFEQSTRKYIDDSMGIVDELVSIDTIEDISTGFVLIPIHLYVSDGGFDIDVIARERWQKNTVETHKGIIIEQMRSHKLLANLFSSKHHRNPAPSRFPDDTRDNPYQKIHSLLSINDESDFHRQAIEFIFGSRVLLVDELLDFCFLTLSGANEICIYIDDLNYWSKNSKFLTIGSFVAPKSHCSILYKSSSYDTNPSIRRITKSCPNISKGDIKQSDHSSIFRIIVDSKMSIDVNIEQIKVFSESQHIPRITATVSKYSSEECEKINNEQG